MTRLDFDRENLTSREAQLLQALIAVHLLALAGRELAPHHDDALGQARDMFAALFPDITFRLTEPAHQEL